MLAIAAALALSGLAGLVVATKAMPGIAVSPGQGDPALSAQVQDVSSRRDREREERERESRSQRRTPVDCHRDVRTHRVDGVLIRHRHVGQNCAVREVRRGTDRSPDW